MLGAHVVFRDLAVEIFVRIPFLLAADSRGKQNQLFSVFKKVKHNVKYSK